MAEKDMNSKVLEELNDVFSDISNVLLFNGKNVISENDLTESTTYSNYTANGKIREQERDVAKYWNNSEIRIAMVGFENQIKDDPDMPLRVLNYDAASYRAQFSPTNSNPRFPVVTLVLYFGYKHHWSKAKTLYEQVNVPDELVPYVNDYKINLFEIAYLTDEQIKMFKSDFKFVADYYVQMRKTGKYIPPTEKIEHVSELLGMMSALTKDNRFIESYENLKGKEKVNMCEVLDEVEARGIAKGEVIGEAKGIAIGEAKGIVKGEAQGEERLGKLITILMNNNDSSAVTLVASDKKARDEYYKKYNL